LVEHTTENRGVAGSIPALATWGCAAAPACVLGRSRQSTRRFLRPWQAGVLAGK
jgi:hypothetical protein